MTVLRQYPDSMIHINTQQVDVVVERSLLEHVPSNVRMTGGDGADALA